MRNRLCIGFFCLSSIAHADIESEWLWEAHYHKEWQRYDLDRGNNPGNAILLLSDHTDRLELQPEFVLRGEPFELTLQPRATHTKVRVLGSRDSSDSDLSLRYWHLDYYLGSQWFKAGSYVNAWGPARLLSPSNRYHTNTGQTDPNIELMAREYFEWGGHLNSDWQFQLTVNTGEGDQILEDFEITGDLQLTWQGKQVSATALVSKPEQGIGVGGYGQWTVNGALIVYGDFLYLSEGRSLEHLLPQRGTADSEPLLAAVAGVSYTFENGWNLALDYYHNQLGLHGPESEALLTRNREYTTRLLAGETNAEFADLLHQVNNLPFYQLGKSYALTMLQRNNIRDDIDIGYTLIRNLSDHSGQHVLNVEYRWLDFLAFYGGVNHFSGSEDTEFGRFLNWQITAGVKAYF